MKKQKKLLDISTEAVKCLSIEAIEKGFGNFKNFAENIIEQSAVAVAKKKKNVR